MIYAEMVLWSLLDACSGLWPDGDAGRCFGAGLLQLHGQDDRVQLLCDDGDDR